VTDETDRARFERLYSEHRRDLLGYFLRRADPDDAADLLAETFLVAWRRMSVVPNSDAARLWLFGVARNTLRNHRRSSRTAHDLAAALHEVLARSPQPGPDSALALSVRAALDGLNPPDREVMMLAVYEELTPSEISQVTGRSVASVRVRLHRARRRVGAQLDDVSPVAALIPAAVGGRDQRLGAVTRAVAPLVLAAGNDGRQAGRRR
jgi:RNA polymerase sigma factor (sigma-70 family)